MSIKAPVSLYVYRALVGVFVCSGVFYLCMQAFTPFSVRMVWVAEGAGGTLALTRPADSLPRVGDRVAFATEQSSGVHTIQVGQASRVDGNLLYRDAATEWSTVPYRAQDVRGYVLFELPVLGFLVHALSHPIGVMGLLGMPLVMMMVDLFQAFRERMDLGQARRVRPRRSREYAVGSE